VNVDLAARRRVSIDEMKLRDFTWWPKRWLTEAGQLSPADQVRRGHLEECDLGPNGLILVVNDYYGERVFGSIPQPSFKSPQNMVGLLDFLLEHIGEPIAAVEDLDVKADRFN
jgi:hypothetical protein